MIAGDQNLNEESLRFLIEIDRVSGKLGEIMDVSIFSPALKILDSHAKSRKSAQTVSL